MPTRHSTLTEARESRCRAACDLLGAILLALCVFLPFFLWFVGVWQ